MLDKSRLNNLNIITFYEHLKGINYSNEQIKKQ